MNLTFIHQHIKRWQQIFPSHLLSPRQKKLLTKLDYFCQRFLLKPITLILLFTLLVFRKIFTQGLIPVPGDLLVSFYFPWYNGGFAGYDSWTSHKAFLGSDTIRQDIPWRFLAIDMFKHGHWPLWNPYNFSGTPLLANLQSAVFYPLNIVFFIFPFMPAWVIYIVVQPILFASFTYLFIRSLKLSKAASLLASMAVTGSTFFIIWLEIGIVDHTILWLPLMLFATEKLHQHLKLRYILIFISAASFSLFSGHFQTAIHTFILVGLYWLYKTFTSHLSLNKKIRSLILLGTIFSVAIAIVSIQLLPALELKPLSPMSESFAKEVFLKIKTPVKNLVTFFAPDFFGNPATNNFTSDIYGDGTPFIGVVPLLFSLFALIAINTPVIWFWGTITLIYLSYGFPGPGYHLASLLHISLFTSTLSSRSLIIVVFSLSVLSAYGLDHLLTHIKQKSVRRKYLSALGIFSLIYAILWLFVLIAPHLQGLYQFFGMDLAAISVAKRNLILPTGVYICLFISSILFLSSTRLKRLFLLGIFLPSILFVIYHYNKTLSFASTSFFFPDHPLIQQLQSQPTPDRAIGFTTAKFDKNFSTYYRIYSPEGYDSLRIQRYAELIASQETGQVPAYYSKSDADFIENENGLRRRLLDLISVKYILDKNDTEIHDWNPELFKFPNDQVELIWQQGKFKIYQRATALNRAYLVGKYTVISDSQSILNAIYDPQFDLSSTAILETDLSDHQKLQPPTNSQVSIDSYQENQVKISASADTNTLLVLTDAYYPGWKVYVDGKQTPIYRANYAFRAIYLPSGDHQVLIIYSPDSFKIGLMITAASLLGIVIASIYLIQTKKIQF